MPPGTKILPLEAEGTFSSADGGMSFVRDGTLGFLGRVAAVRDIAVNCWITPSELTVVDTGEFLKTRTLVSLDLHSVEAKATRNLMAEASTRNAGLYSVIYGNTAAVQDGCSMVPITAFTALRPIEKPQALLGYDRYAVPNWDGYDADPITAETLSAARKFMTMLPATLGKPDIAPGADGTIGFEWILASGPLRKLFIDIGPGGIWSGYWRRSSGAKQSIKPSPVNQTTALSLSRLFAGLMS